MVTIKDVAKKAGVSPSTVSRVLNESAAIKDSTRKKVLAAVEIKLPKFSCLVEGGKPKPSV